MIKEPVACARQKHCVRSRGYQREIHLSRFACYLMRNRNTIEFLGMREQQHNPAFDSIEFGGIRNEAEQAILTFEWRLQ